MRGTLGCRDAVINSQRIIPAHAGNTIHPEITVVIVQDHPRACGEHRPEDKEVLQELGSSPRMRGTPDKILPLVRVGRIIPAHAGNTKEVRVGEVVKEDHPRACGEHHLSLCRRRQSNGSSPRMRGTQFHLFSSCSVIGIIPAHAGNTILHPCRRRSRWDHPRACGEHHRRFIRWELMQGSSPRMRGTPDMWSRESFIGRIIPAHAGNT